MRGCFKKPKRQAKNDSDDEESWGYITPITANMSGSKNYRALISSMYRACGAFVGNSWQ